MPIVRKLALSIAGLLVFAASTFAEPAAYLDPDGARPGYYTIAPGDSEPFVATKRNVFGRRAVGYRIDTWDDAAGWQKGAVQNSRSVTLDGENSFRRLVWIWQRASDGLTIFVR